MISRTMIKARMHRKTNPSLAETILMAHKNKGWNEVAKLISTSTRNHSSVNLSDIDKNTKEGDTVIIPGKVLGSGNLTKKVRICSLAISESAKEKLKETKSEYVSIAEEIKINSKAQGIKIIR
ncbi:50S ribosomal protein L18e [Candidatus Pacearchaeota archaeon]|nr:50S ribosomal protein L18e [Candidatus Pacearchaeota archaeon]